MSEFFTRPPEIPEAELNAPKYVPPEAAFTRTLATVLMLIWCWWWWHGMADGAWWIVAAAVFFVTGETAPKLYTRLLFLWWPLSFVALPVARLILWITRLIIPERYRRPQQVQQPLSFKQINDALDEAAEARDQAEQGQGTHDQGKKTGPPEA